MGNWFRGEWTEVTAEHLAKKKSGWYGGYGAERFRCNLCGYRFKLGDLFRAIFTNCKADSDRGIPGGNPLVCQACDPESDQEAMKQKWKQLYEDANQPKFWTFWPVSET